MEEMQDPTEETFKFPERIGEDYELWKKYHEVHGAEAYRFRRIAEALSKHLSTVYEYAQENNIRLPGDDESGMILT